MTDQITYAIYYAGKYIRRFKTHEEALDYGIERFGRGSKNWDSGWTITQVIE